jgi:hypothetical protein
MPDKQDWFQTWLPSCGVDTGGIRGFVSAISRLVILAADAFHAVRNFSTTEICGSFDEKHAKTS